MARNPDSFISFRVKDYIMMLPAPTGFIIEVMTALMPSGLDVSFDVPATGREFILHTLEDKASLAALEVVYYELVLLHSVLLGATR